MNTPQQQAVRSPLVVAAGAGPTVDLGDHRGHIKVSARHSGGDFVLVETRADPQGGVPPHIHTREDETFYILEGRFAIQVGQETVEVGPGDTVFAPRDVAHSWYCVGDTPGRFVLLISLGANFEAFAIEMGQRGFVPAQAMSDPSTAAEFMGLAERYGIGMLPAAK